MKRRGGEAKMNLKSLFSFLVLMTTCFVIFLIRQPGLNSDNLQKPNISSEASFDVIEMIDLSLSFMLRDKMQLGKIFSRLMVSIETNTKEYLKMGALINDAVNGEIDDDVKPSLNIHLLATWSSGSTFLTKLLTHYPGVFLTFEPLILFNTYDALENKHVNSSYKLLKEIFQCNYAENGFGRKFLNFIKNPKNNYKQWALHNLRLRTVCEGLVDESNKLCYDPGYVGDICKIHPIQLVKTVRMRTKQIAPILDDKDLNLKLLVLIRDPRAVRSSRNGIGWCNFEACNSLEVLCQHYEDDLNVAIELSKSNPKNILIVKYEELVLKPYDVIPIILKFLEIDWHPSLNKFIHDHMMTQESDSKQGSNKYIHTQSEVSSSVADKWRQKLSQDEIDKIQKTCRRAIRMHENFSML